MIRRLGPRETKILFTAAAVVISAGALNMIYMPLQNKKFSLNERIMDARRHMAAERAVIQKASQVDGRYQNYLGRFALAGTEEEAVAAVLKELEEMIRKLSLSIGDLKPGPLKNEGAHYVFTVSLSLNDDLPGLVRFLYALQQAPHYFDVDEMRIEKEARRNEPGLKTRLDLSKVFVLTHSTAPKPRLSRRGSQDKGNE